MVDATGRSVGRIPSPRQGRRSAAVEPFGQQNAPTLIPIRAIHRGPQGFVSFARKVDGAWEDLGAMSTDTPLLPELERQLAKSLASDSYFGLNSDYRKTAKHGTRHRWRPIAGMPGAEELKAEAVRQRTHRETGLQFVVHRVEDLRWLNCCHIDLDCYNVGIKVGDALGNIINLQDGGQLPPATVFVRSGRGLWALWFLVDIQNPREGERIVHGMVHRPDTSQRASKRALALYARVQRALADRLRHLGADIPALDAARFAPVPGTYKTNAETRVEYWLQANGDGRAFVYTLPELAKALGLELSTTAHPIVAAALSDHADPAHAPNPVKAAAGRKGWRVRFKYLLADFEILRRRRGGGFDQGVRNIGAFYYALILKRNGMEDPDIGAHLAVYGSLCRPQLTPREQRDALRSAVKARRFPSNAKLCADLGVTDTEATYLAHLRPAPLAVPHQDQTHRRELVRKLLAQCAAQRHAVPSTRVMAELLAPYGVSTNASTVWRDYIALGVNAPKSKGGRPPKRLLELVS